MADTTKKYSMEDLFADYGINYANPEDYAAKAKETTQAKYASDRTDLANTTNQYYNNLYNTQNTVMDTIRQSNAQAVASGASKGVQAATTLSALLGLQNESVQGATELANESIKLAQDETAAVLEAEQKAREAAENINTQRLSIIPDIKNSDTARMAEARQLYADGNYTEAAKIWNKIFNAGSSQPGIDPITGEKVIQATNVNNVFTWNAGDKSVYGKYMNQFDVDSNGLKGDAGSYIAQIEKDTANGKIKPGQVVNLNYGDVADKQFGGSPLTYRYLGNNQWEKISDIWGAVKTDNDLVYVPEGYRKVGSKIYKN